MSADQAPLVLVVARLALLRMEEHTAALTKTIAMERKGTRHRSYPWSLFWSAPCAFTETFILQGWPYPSLACIFLLIYSSPSTSLFNKCFLSWSTFISTEPSLIPWLSMRWGWAHHSHLCIRLASMVHKRNAYRTTERWSASPFLEGSDDEHCPLIKVENPTSNLSQGSSRRVEYCHIIIFSCVV